MKEHFAVAERDISDTFIALALIVLHIVVGECIKGTTERDEDICLSIDVDWVIDGGIGFENSCTVLNDHIPGLDACLIQSFCIVVFDSEFAMISVDVDDLNFKSCCLPLIEY